MAEGEAKGAEAAAVLSREGAASPFERYTPDDVRDLIREFPLAWVYARGGGAEAASLLPMVGEYDAAGRLTHLVGHFARYNALLPALSGNPRGLFLFTGPQSYISPGAVGDRSWAPTWNYAQVRIEAEVAFDPDCTEESLEILVEAMEGSRPAPWGARELGDRYNNMVTRIIGFRARVTEVRGRFKLGQDEEPAIFRSIIDNAADPAMRRWMLRFDDRGG